MKEGLGQENDLRKYGNNDRISTGEVRDMDNRSASGLRRSPYLELTPEDIEFLKSEIKAIGADESVFRFNEGSKTAYSDRTGNINVRGDVFPDLNSIHPRDVMSERAVLAHEYYGHYCFSPSGFRTGDWRDEFRASYIAAIKTPNLTDDDRRLLVLDAYERAREAGKFYKYSQKAREIIYGC
jgi:hypothetical protein